MEESTSRSVMDDRVRVNKRRDTLHSRKCYFDCMDLSIDNQDERKLVDEVFRIKSILDNKKADVEYGSWEVYHSLKKLQKMVLSVKILKITMIGSSVTPLKKHAFEHVSAVARMLVKHWKHVVDEWVDAMEEKSVVNLAINPQRPYAAIEKESMVNQEQLTIIPQRPCSESVQHMDDVLKETAIEKTVSVLQNHVTKDVSETTTTLVKDWKDLVNETTKNESSIVKKTSEKPEAQKGSIARYQPVDSRVQTGDQQGPAGTIFEKKFQALKSKMRTSYKEIECLKKKRNIQVLQLNELPRQDHQIQPVNKRQRR